MTFLFKHPDYYKKLKASHVKKAISPDDAAAPAEGRTPQATSSKPQAPSSKLQAPSLERNELQASSPKHKGSSFKPQASSSKILEPGYR